MNATVIKILLLVLVLGAPSAGTAQVASMAAATALEQGGQFAAAARQWQALHDSAGDLAGKAEAMLGKAGALLAAGLGTDASEAANLALRLAQQRGDLSRGARAQHLLAAAALAAGRNDQARQALAAAEALAALAERRDLQAALRNEQGNLLVEEGRPAEALAAYREAARMAGDHGPAPLLAQALLNGARTAGESGSQKTAAELLVAAASAIEKLPDGHGKAMALIAAGEIGERTAPADARTAQQAQQAYSAALAIAEAAGDTRAQSFALGYLGRLYERAGRLDEAAQLTRRAIFVVADDDADLLYRWHWQSGRIHKSAGRPDAAIPSYRNAVQYLQQIRPDLSARLGGRSSFRAVLGPLYFELADLLLARAARAGPGPETGRVLEEARATIELSKAAELQDYFQDSCVAEQQARVGRLQQVGAGTAVIYPILLPDRTEIIVNFADGPRLFSVAAGAEAVTELVRDYRIKLERRTTRQYLQPARRLYDLLIRPLEGELRRHAVDTLVFVPDGALRTVPMGALHDGTAFLVARYALATTPGMSLTDTQPLEKRALQLLVNGITLPVQGFPPLPAVADELQALQTQSPTATTLRDADFIVPNVERELGRKPFSVMHIASHGEFSADASQTFLLAFDQKLTMNRLEALIGPSRYRRQPIELLTLSACQSAAGDDRAALGLAGVAIKAGVRSALASLWYINDESTATLMADFYRQVGGAGTSKARALQLAQIALARDTRYAHPYYWAPFLLIGNWL